MRLATMRSRRFRRCRSMRSRPTIRAERTIPIRARWASPLRISPMSSIPLAPPPSHLRYVIFGGDELEPAILKPWYARHSDRSPRLVNMYGITGTTVQVSSGPMDLAHTAISENPIGRRIPDLRVYVLDAHRQPV